VSRVSAEMVAGLDELLSRTEAAIELPREFVVPGETRLSAALELARTIVDEPSGEPSQSADPTRIRTTSWCRT